VAQTERVSDLVDDLLTDAVEEGFVVVVHLAAVGGHTETVCGDDAALSFEVGETEDEVALAVEDVDVRDSEVLVAPSDALRDGYDTFGVVLTALVVVRRLRDVDGRPGDDLSAVPLAQDVARGFDSAGVRVADRDEVDPHNKGLAGADNKACVDAVADYITERYTEGARIVEVGVGRRADVARRLAREGYDVTTTDVRDVHDAVGDHINFVRDDVREPDASVYSDAVLVYSLRPPYEIHAALADVAREAEADLLVAPLADEGVGFDAELVNYEGRAFFVKRF